MIFNSEMIEIFGKENLVYANVEKLNKTPLPNEVKKFLSTTGFPYLIGDLRFSLDLEYISEDSQLNNFQTQIGNCIIIGCKAPTRLIGRLIHLEELKLPREASLSEIAKQAEILGENEYYNWDAETRYSWRVCIDLQKNNRIIYINTMKDLSVTKENLSVGFVNSDIEKLATSLAVFWKILNSEEDKDMTKKMSIFKERMQIIDPEALRNKDSLWNVLVEILIHEIQEY